MSYMTEQHRHNSNHETSEFHPGWFYNDYESPANELHVTNYSFLGPNDVDLRAHLIDSPTDYYPPQQQQQHQQSNTHANYYQPLNPPTHQTQAPPVNHLRYIEPQPLPQLHPPHALQQHHISHQFNQPNRAPLVSERPNFEYPHVAPNYFHQAGGQQSSLTSGPTVRYQLVSDHQRSVDQNRVYRSSAVQHVINNPHISQPPFERRQSMPDFGRVQVPLNFYWEQAYPHVNFPVPPPQPPASNNQQVFHFFSENKEKDEHAPQHNPVTKQPETSNGALISPPSLINSKGKRKTDHELREEFYRGEFRNQTNGKDPPRFFPTRSAYDESFVWRVEVNMRYGINIPLYRRLNGKLDENYRKPAKIVPPKATQNEGENIPT